MVLFVHNRYRTTGGEERVVDDLAWLVRERLGQRAEILARESSGLSRRRAALGLLRGGLAPGEVADAVRRSGAARSRTQPAPDLRLAGAGGRPRGRGECGAAPSPVPTRVRSGGVLHPRGGVHALPRTQHAAGSRAQLSRQPGGGGQLRGGARALAAAGGRARRCRAGAQRLRRAEAALAGRRSNGSGAGAPPAHARVGAAADARQPTDRPALPERYALIVSPRPEEGIDVAIEACRRAGIALVLAGEDPARGVERRLRHRHRPGPFPPRRRGLSRLRAGARCAPPRARRTFGLALAEAMAAGVPAVGRGGGAAGDTRGRAVAAGDPDALARAMRAAPGTVRGRAGPGADRLDMRAGGRRGGPEAAYGQARAARPRGLGWRAVPERQTALITGITGQDGSFLAELLLEKGYR